MRREIDLVSGSSPSDWSDLCLTVRFGCARANGAASGRDGSLQVMPGSAHAEGPPDRIEPPRPSDDVLPQRARRSLEVGISLYHLALQYRLEGRPGDQRRVASEARRLLGSLPSS